MRARATTARAVRAPRLASPATAGADDAGGVVVAAVDSGVAAPVPAHAVSVTRMNEAKRMAHCARSCGVLSFASQAKRFTSLVIASPSQGKPSSSFVIAFPSQGKRFFSLVPWFPSQAKAQRTTARTFTFTLS